MLKTENLFTFIINEILKEKLDFCAVWKLQIIITRINDHNILENETNWTYIRRFEGFQEVLWTSYIRSIYVFYPGGRHSLKNPLWTPKPSSPIGLNICSLLFLIIWISFIFIVADVTCLSNVPKAYSESCQTSKIELFAKKIEGCFQPFAIFCKKLHLGCLTEFWNRLWCSLRD